MQVTPEMITAAAEVLFRDYESQYTAPPGGVAEFEDQAKRALEAALATVDGTEQYVIEIKNTSGEWHFAQMAGGSGDLAVEARRQVLEALRAHNGLGRYTHVRIARTESHTVTVGQEVAV